MLTAPVLPSTAGARLLGLTGAPGSGKSTLTQVLLDDGTATGCVPMDGYHYADVELVRRGLLDRKGAPETFDAPGYAVLLGRVARREADVVAPAFERALEQPLAGAIHVPATGLIVTEGNYLLLDEPRWRAARAHVDVVWHLHVNDGLRRERLVARHVRFGKSPAEARAWVARVDEPNAERVKAAADRADAVIDLTDWS